MYIPQIINRMINTTQSINILHLLSHSIKGVVLLWLSIQKSTIQIQSIRQSHVTGPSVLSKIGPYHRSPRQMSKRSIMWQTAQKEIWPPNQPSNYILHLFYTCGYSLLPAKPISSSNNLFWAVQCLKFYLCQRSPAPMANCLTDPMCHSHSGCLID
jgi:hypothetical protein